MRKEGNLFWVTSCGAKSKRNGGKPCPQPAMANGRCRFHGGKTPSGRDSVHFIHGYYCKEAIVQRKLIRDMIRVMRKQLGDI